VACGARRAAREFHRLLATAGHPLERYLEVHLHIDAGLRTPLAAKQAVEEAAAEAEIVAGEDLLEIDAAEKILGREAG
jgi:hypothetical protein